jgi:hypothetical protein
VTIITIAIGVTEISCIASGIFAIKLSINAFLWANSLLNLHKFVVLSVI